jgi:predicted amidophosphoribosyltransferase
MNWSCPKCGTTNSNAYSRCKECNNDKPGAMKWSCKRCGTTNSNAYSRCKECNNDKPR